MAFYTVSHLLLGGNVCTARRVRRPGP